MAVEEGSIVARLRVDSSDYRAKLAEAQAQAEELGRTDPHIRVDVDSAKAIAQLEAVAVAEDHVSRSMGRLNTSSGLNVTRMGLIVTAIALLIPMLAALSGYAVGVAGALAGMGAAGVLAVIGIKNAMAEGNAEGLAYSAGLRGLKRDLDSLAGTAATNMLASFQRAVMQINAAMPGLNAQIAGFSSQLGQVGNTVLAGVIQSFKVLNPLFVQAGQYVQSLAEGFKRWTEDGGLQKFADYAQQALPKVADVLGTLAKAILHIIEATEPIGTVVLATLKGLGDAINAIPTQVLTALIVLTGGVFAAFKTWTLIAPIITTATTALSGLSVAEASVSVASAGMGLGIAAAAAGLAYFVGQAIDSARVALGLQQSVDTLQKSVSKFDMKGVSQNTHAAVLGVQTDISTLGQVANSGWASGFIKGSYDVFHSVLQFQPVWKAFGIGANDFTGHISDIDSAMAKLVSSGHAKQATAAYKDLAAQTDGSKQAIANLKSYLPQYEAAMSKTVPPTEASSQKLDVLGRTAQQVGTAITALSQKIAGFGQTNLSVSQAEVAFHQSIDDATAAVAQNGATLDLNTQQGRNNMNAIDGIASATIANVAAGAKANETQAQLTGTMAQGRAAFIAAAIAAGDTAAQANNLADQYGLIPANVTTAINATGAENAIDAAHRVQAAYAEIERHISTSYSINGVGNQAQIYGAGNTLNADGNMYVHGARQMFADGGFASGIYAGRPGGIHKFAEPETGWEAYISGKPGQEGRNAGIALTALSKLGYRQPQPPASNITHYHNTFNISEATDADAVAQRVDHYLMNQRA